MTNWESRAAFEPLRIKELLLECGISQADLSRIVKVSPASVNLAVNRGKMPARSRDFRERVEEFIRGDRRAAAWMAERGVSVKDLWTPLGKDLRKQTPRGHGISSVAKRRQKPIAVDADAADITEKEAEMLTREALHHFKLFRSPFINDVRDVDDIFLSEDHRFIQAAMVDAARNQGFLAVIGEVGSGKSVMRKKAVAEIRADDNARIIFPRMIDKTRISAASLCDAIILDLSDEKPRVKLEQKARQVERLLVSRSQASCHVCLLIEEAHDLEVRVLKLLKRFYEIEDGYRKALGIVLIGQPELGRLFNEADHYDMREVIRRCQVAEIHGLNGDVKSYLTYKFNRSKAELGKVITDDAITALSDRLSEPMGRGRVRSHAYPLTVNNLVTRAMNLAADMGEKLVTTEVIEAL